MLVVTANRPQGGMELLDEAIFTKRLEDGTMRRSLRAIIHGVGSQVRPV